MVEFNGRIVLRNDSSANWTTNKDAVLLKGEVGFEFHDDGSVTMKVGDGVKTWEQLSPFEPGKTSSTNFYEAESQEGEDDIAALTRVVGEAELAKGDIGVVKKLIHNDKYEYTAYYYDTTWKALDGNYNAENVYFDKDLLTTSAIGNITLSNGQATIPVQGKNLKQVFDTIFVAEKNPSTTQPSVSVSLPQAKAYEVGTKVTPSYTATLNAGSYTYGPATGITATSWAISDTNSNSATSNTGSFSEITIEDGTNYKITAVAQYEDGAIPVTNTGNPYPTGQIKKGSKTGSSGAITGYRNTFYGTLEAKTEPDSTVIRSLNKSNKALANGAKFTVSIPVGALRVIIAYPATLRDVTSILDVNGMNAEIKSSFVKTTKSVADAAGTNPIDYKVFTLDFAKANDTQNSFSVTI